MPPQSEGLLWQQLEQASTLSEYRRIQCVYLREKYGYTSNQIADITTYYPASVRRIQSKYRKHGIGALSSKSKGGRYHQKLSLADEQVFIADLATKAESGQIIEISEIHRAYGEKVGKPVGKSTVYALLRRHQWRKVVPRPQPPKHDEQAVDALKKFPKLIEQAQTEAKERGLSLRVMLQDEARFGRINEPKKCWAPKGIRPVVMKQTVREYTYVYGAVSPIDGVCDFLILPHMDSYSMNLFLAEISQRHPNEFILMIYDQAPSHSKSALEIPERMMVETLPPYCPQLNPVEHVWDELRGKFFPNLIFNDMAQLEETLIEGLLYFEAQSHIV